MANLGPFPDNPVIAVAVSGGPDSMALVLLMAEWAADKGGKVVALTVDHGLRAESKSEALQVGAWLHPYKIDHHILSWTAPKPVSGIQEEARNARYALMGQWCAEHSILYLALGHQLQDQAETFLLRVRQGSGLDGLSAMAPVRQTRDVCLIRPVLGISRDRLIATLMSKGQEFVDDPSNANSRYERVRMRHLIADLGLSSEGLFELTQVLGRARKAMEDLVERADSLLVSYHSMGFAVVDGDGLVEAPYAIGIRVLSRVVQRIGGQPYPPRGDRLDRLYKAQSGTLAGCRVVKKPGNILVLCRESRGVAPLTPIISGQSTVWDGRFVVTASATCPSGVSVGALGARGWEQVKKECSITIPAMIRTTLPAIWIDGELCLVPHLGYKSSQSACIFVDCHYFSLEALSYNQAPQPRG